MLFVRLDNQVAEHISREKLLTSIIRNTMDTHTRPQGAFPVATILEQCGPLSEQQCIMWSHEWDHIVKEVILHVPDYVTPQGAT